MKPQADSLQELWEKRIPGKKVKSELHAIVYYFELDTSVDEAYADIQHAMPWSTFTNKYGALETGKNLSVSLRRITDYKGEKKISLECITGFCRASFRDTFINIFDLNGKYNVQTYNPSQLPDYKGYLKGLFVERVIESDTIPYPYAEWVQYTELITGTEPLFINRYESIYTAHVVQRPARDRFFQYIHIPGMPEPKEIHGVNAAFINFENTHFPDIERYRVWQQKRALHIREYLEDTKQFKFLLIAAVDECIRLKVPDELLEIWACQYLELEDAQMMMRLRPIFSGCGNDPAPTIRRYEIAKFSLFFTWDWHVFIRAHLDLINDRTDWSINYKTRFVGELEALGLDVPTLLLGSILKVNAEGHYHGNLHRTGWALAQCKNADAVADQLTKAIADDKLDDDNRLQLYQVYRAMLYRKNWRNLNIQWDSNWKMVDKELEAAKNSLPKRLHESLEHLNDF